MKLVSLFIMFSIMFTNTLYTNTSFYSLFFSNNKGNTIANGTEFYDFLDDNVIYSSNINEYDSFLVSYYDNLTHNFGVNYKSTCGYVAIGMLLSYYDTYLNDQIIPEQYDVASVGEGSDIISRRNSPGILRDVISAPENYPYDDDTYVFNLDENEYYTEITKISNISLHAKLITRGGYYGYYARYGREIGVLTFLEIKHLLIDHLTNTAGINSDQYEITSINDEMYNNTGTSDEVKEFALQQIKLGNPVLLSIYKSNTNIGHAVIAYDCDYKDDIFCHMGYGADMTHVTPESQGYTRYESALVINFNFDHSHSNNYGVTTETNNIVDTTYYCYDDCRILTYTNTHSYIANYESENNITHKAYCQCGAYSSQAHELVANVCVLCGCEHTHEYTTWTYISTTQHREMCECGMVGIRTANHAVSNTETGRFRRCVGCNARIDMNSDFSQTESTERPVTANGSYILPNGIIVLVDEDITAYLNGELVFYNENNNVTTS